MGLVGVSTRSAADRRFVVAGWALTAAAAALGIVLVGSIGTMLAFLPAAGGFVGCLVGTTGTRPGGLGGRRVLVGAAAGTALGAAAVAIVLGLFAIALGG